MSTPTLLLKSIRIQNFRAFKDLKIPSLGRVNLIVGKNNVGKSSFLEAVEVYANRDHATLWQVLTNREEGTYPTKSNDNSIEQRLKALRFLFHGRDGFVVGFPSIYIGEIDTWKKIQIKFEWRLISYDIEESTEPHFTIISDHNIPITDSFRDTYPTISDIKKIPCTFIPTTGLSKESIDLLWSKIALTENEKEILDAIRIIESSIDAVGVITNHELGMKRIAIARSSKSKEPFSIQSMGDGINRLFYMTLALVNSRDGFLLIDEVGAGLHYSVQLELWRLIFSIASKLNVQIFATTHSNDCILAFQIASRESPEDGMLIRLEKRGDEIVPILFDEDRLAIATQAEIEVR